jgi:hypothetical protein
MKNTDGKTVYMKINKEIKTYSNKTPGFRSWGAPEVR